MAESVNELRAALSVRLSGPGSPSARQLAADSGWGRTLVNDVKLGRRLPNGTQLQDILTAAGVGQLELQRWADRLATVHQKHNFPDPEGPEPGPLTSEADTRADAGSHMLVPTKPTPRASRLRPNWRFLICSPTIAVVGVMLLVVVSIGLWWISRPQVGVTGKVRCSTGQPVVGVWVQSRRQGGSYAKVRRGEDGWFTYNGWAIANHSYRLHIGCGGQPGDWRSESRTQQVKAVNLTLSCDDSPTVLATPPYLGRCSVHR